MFILDGPGALLIQNLGGSPVICLFNAAGKKGLYTTTAFTELHFHFTFMLNMLHLASVKCANEKFIVSVHNYTFKQSM